MIQNKERETNKPKRNREDKVFKNEHSALYFQLSSPKVSWFSKVGKMGTIPFHIDSFTTDHPVTNSLELFYILLHFS